MDIYIFSAGRPHRQDTIVSLQKALAHHTPHLVVQDQEYKAYDHVGWGAQWPLLKLPAKLPRTLPAARQHVVKVARHEGQRQILMLDDDLSFSVRRSDEPDKFAAMGILDHMEMLATIEDVLHNFASVGLCSREGGNRMTEDNVAGRMSRVLGYNLDLVPKDVKFDAVLLPEDFDVTLQLLTRGLPNIVLKGWCHNQPGSNTAGGCSAYRTIEVHNAAMQIFGKRWPDFVKIVEKQTKTGWGGQARLDAHVQWKKAYRWGLSHANS